MIIPMHEVFDYERDYINATMAPGYECPRCGEDSYWCIVADGDNGLECLTCHKRYEGGAMKKTLRELMNENNAGGFLFCDRGAGCLGPFFFDWSPASEKMYGDTIMREVSADEFLDPAINRLAPNGWVSDWMPSVFVANQEIRFYF